MDKAEKSFWKGFIDSYKDDSVYAAQIMLIITKHLKIKIVDNVDLSILQDFHIDYMNYWDKWIYGNYPVHEDDDYEPFIEINAKTREIAWWYDERTFKKLVELNKANLLEYLGD